jgi:hypothetical protein
VIHNVPGARFEQLLWRANNEIGLSLCVPKYFPDRLLISSTNDTCVINLLALPPGRGIILLVFQGPRISLRSMLAPGFRLPHPWQGTSLRIFPHVLSAHLIVPRPVERVAR